MFSNILGWAWVVMGVFFFCRPQFLKNKLQKKAIRKIRGQLFLLALIISGVLMRISWGVPGVWAKIVFIIGILGVIKAFFLLQGKIVEKIAQWLSSKPPAFFRLGALFHIGFGLVLVFMK